jgi:hypothetical protein
MSTGVDATTTLTAATDSLIAGRPAAPEVSDRERAEQLRRTVAPDLYTPDVYVPWPQIEAQLARLERPTATLQEVVDKESWDESLAEVLLQPGVLDVVRSILVAPSSVGFADGRELPVERPPTSQRARELAALLLDIGLPRVMPAGSRVPDLLRVGLISMDARRRGFRRRDAVEAEVRRLLRQAVLAVEEQLGLKLENLPQSQWPQVVRGRAEAVLAVGNTPIAAVLTVFQAQSGGRQQRDLAETYPRLQRQLDEIPMALILVLDGRGVQETPRLVLERLVSQVGACVSRLEAAEGALANALADAAQNLGMRRGQLQAVETLIETALQRQLQVTVNELGDQREQILIALAEYRLQHPDLALELDPIAGRLSWSRPDLVAVAQAVRRSFKPEQAVQLLSQLLDMADVEPVETSHPTLLGLFGSLPNDQVLPQRLLIAGTTEASGSELLKRVARLNRQQGFGGGLAALVTAGGQASVPAQVQRVMTTSVVVVGPESLVRIAASRAPRDEFVKLVLAQADLTKANPFNPTGATSGRMFFGREEEEARLQATLDSNSVALLGGRQIGKTSLLQRAVQSLLEAGWSAHYADCQAVGNWRDFAAYIGVEWGVELTSEFEPAAVSHLLAQLRERAGGPLVIALDEIDSLLAWDEAHDTGRPTEALFRALRAASQQGAAQFIFSGERRIASRMWDPASPHWNFCRPIEIRQLTRQASDALIEVPLQALGVELGRRQETLELTWLSSSGHPQILQFLGDRVVRLLNGRPAVERSYVDAEAVAEVVGSPDFRRHYVDTYWGQATDYERSLTACVALGDVTIAQLRGRLSSLAMSSDEKAISQGLRMLALYGILEDPEEPLRFRAARFPTYLDLLGGPSAVLTDFTSGVTA